MKEPKFKKPEGMEDRSWPQIAESWGVSRYAAMKRVNPDAKCWARKRNQSDDWKRKKEKEAQEARDIKNRTKLLAW